MNTIQNLIQGVSAARTSFLDMLTGIEEAKTRWKPDPEIWCVIEITEHLFWAEQGALFGMWKTLHAIREGAIERSYESVHKDLPIQKIIDLTWQPKEKVPAVAAPRLGGTLSFWKASLASLQDVLAAFGQDLKEDELRLQAHPHPISGPLDFQQRLEFLKFHIDRHAAQVAHLFKAYAEC